MPDNKTYVGYRYIIIDGQKKVFVQMEAEQPKDENAKRVTKLINIEPNALFREKEEFMQGDDNIISLTDAISLMTFASEGTRYYMDLNQIITCGEGSDKELESGRYLALAVFTDKNLIQEAINGLLPVQP